MRNLIQRAIEGIGRSAASGLLGLTLLGVPAIAGADGNDKNKDQDVLRLFKATEKIMERVENRLNEEYAQADQTQQNQVPYSQPQQDPAQLPQNQRHYFTCKYTTGNGSYPQSYIEIKDTFSVSEPLVLVDYDPFSKAGDKERIEIYGPNKVLVARNEIQIPRDGAPVETKAVNGSADFVSRAGFGTYDVVFFLNDQKVKEIDLTITP